MTEVWDLSVQAVRRFYDVVVGAVSQVSWDPATWGRDAYLVAAGVVVAVFLLVLWGRRRRRAAGGPQFLLTNGVVVLLGEAEVAAEADGGPRRPAYLAAPGDADMQLRVTFNNLNAYPVQLLEVALTTGGARLPVVADASAVVPPNGAVDVVADVRDLPGERGTLQVFVFATRARPQNLRVTVPLEWEPWNLRYRVKATHQRVDSARGTASEQVTRMQRAAARRTAARQRLDSAARGVRQRMGEAWASFAERRRAAAAQRRAAAAALAAERAERRAAAGEPTGPFAVPLPPSRRREAEPEPELRRVVETDPGAVPPDPGESRPAEHVTVGEPRVEETREERPRPKLEFPDEF